MLSERPWKLEAVVALLAGLMLGLCAATLGIMSLSHLAANKTIIGNRLVQFIVNTFSFHLIALVLIHFFLRYHGATWRDLFGLRKVRLRVIAAALVVAVLVLPVALALNSLSALVLTRLGLNPIEQTSMQALEMSVTLGQKIIFG